VNSHFHNAAFRGTFLAAALPPVVKPSVSLYTRLGRPKAGQDMEEKEKFIPLPEVQMQREHPIRISSGLYWHLLFNLSQQ
jgi:hypothetical protein